MEHPNNCHGCKWLDEYKENGRGYCSKVERSKQAPPLKVRRPDMERCELYSAGKFSQRYEEKKPE